MDIFLKAAGGILVALVFYLILAKHEKDSSLILTVAVCTIVATAAFSYVKPVIGLMEKLQTLGNLDGQMLGVLLKAVGIALLSEIVSRVCNDAGNGAMGKTVQLLASCVILWLSVPLFTELMDIVEEILVAI